MLTWRKAAVIGGLFVVCTSPSSTQAQTGPRLAWDGQSAPAVTGYAVTIDGVRTNHGLTPLATNGTCGCSIPITFSGGRHTIVVTAYNATGETPSAPLTVAPIANAGGPYVGVSGSAIAVSAANSKAPTGTLTNYAWSWGDGSGNTSSSSPSASHVYTSNGTFTIMLTVTDNAGATASATTTAAVSTSQPPVLPAPWLTQDIGNVVLAGSASYLSSAGRFTIAGAGDDIWNSADAFRYVYQPLNGDGQIVARVTSMQNTHAFAKAGVMIRQSLNANSANTLLNLRPEGGIAVLTRTSAGATTVNVGTTTQAPPAWLKLARSGSSIVASVSADGASWSVVATSSVPMTSGVLIGLVVNSHNTAQLNTGVFDNVAVTAGSSTQPPATPASPTPANGATGVAATSGLTWSAVGATSFDVSFGTANPPPQVAANVTTASYTPAPMLANTLYYWRVVARNAGGTTAGPVWSFTTAPPSTGGAVPAPWMSQDIGNVGIAGMASLSSGTFTIAGGGTGFWTSTDNLHYVHQPMSGDGQIVARVTGLQSTNQYAKAGIMMRASLDPGSPQVTLNLIPGGAQFINRTTANGNASVVANASQSPPGWLKLVRAGSTITGFISANGSTWTQVASTNVALGSAAHTGLAVTSYDASALNTATFDSVAVTAGGPPPPPPPTPSGDVVIHASRVPAAARHGSWRVANDPLSPDQVKLTTPNNGVAATNAPRATPTDYVDITFNADANRPYRLWLRMRASGNSRSNDSVWVQFSDAVVSGSPVFRMNTTSGLLVTLATDSSGDSLLDWGWQNGAYWLSQPTVFTFATSGMHTIRVQVREDGVQFDQIVLSPSTFMNAAPGPVSGDSTIVPIQ